MTGLWIAIAIASFAGFVGVLVADRFRKRRDEAQAYLRSFRSVISGDPDAAILGAPLWQPSTEPELEEGELPSGVYLDTGEALKTRTLSVMPSGRSFRIVLNASIAPFQRGEFSGRFMLPEQSSTMATEPVPWPKRLMT